MAALGDVLLHLTHAAPRVSLATARQDDEELVAAVTGAEIGGSQPAGETPADVKDTGFLTYDYDDESRDDDQWLYLPALKKTKRIASSDKSGSFMGSD